MSDAFVSVHRRTVVPRWPLTDDRQGTRLKRSLLATISLWIERHRQRQALGDLAELNDYLLRDIGLSQEEARREAAKPFWR
jgi:uncharacterized protein YjiS (DUF1127 family)